MGVPTAKHETLVEKETDLLLEREALIAYLLVKVECRDWHAVADAAMDIREIEAALKILASY